MNDLLGGQIQVIFDTVPSALPQAIIEGPDSLPRNTVMRLNSAITAAVKSPELQSVKKLGLIVQ